MKEIIQETRKELQNSINEEFKQIIDKLGDLKASNEIALNMIQKLKVTLPDYEEIDSAANENEGDPIAPEVEVFIELQVRIEASKFLIHPACGQFTGFKVQSLSEINFHSHGIADNTTIINFCTNQNEFSIVDKVFEEMPRSVLNSEYTNKEGCVYVIIRQYLPKYNDSGGGTTISVVLAQGLVIEGVRVVAAGANPIQITRVIDKTTKALVVELKLMAKEDGELADVVVVSAGNNYEVGNMVAKAMSKVGRKGVVTLEEGKSAKNSLYVVEGMQFDHFMTDSEKMVVEYENYKSLLDDKKITNARGLINILEDSIKGGYPLLVIAEDIEQETFDNLVVNKLRGALKIAAFKALGGECKSQYLDDIAILIAGTEIREEVGLSFDKAEKGVLGHAAKVVLAKGTTTNVGDGNIQELVNKRVAQIRNLAEAAEQDFEKEKLNERIEKLLGGVTVIQVGAQTETEFEEKKLRVMDALNATKAAVESIVVGVGCTLLRFVGKVDAIKYTFDNVEQKVGVNSVKSALSCPMKLIAKNSGVNGSVVIEKVFSSDNQKYGYNAATGKYGDLMAAGIIDPKKVVRCRLEHIASVVWTFLTSDVVVLDIKELKPVAAMDNSGVRTIP